MGGFVTKNIRLMPPNQYLDAQNPLGKGVLLQIIYIPGFPAARGTPCLFFPKRPVCGDDWSHIRVGPICAFCSSPPYHQRFDCEANCEADTAYHPQPDTKKGKPVPRVPLLCRSTSSFCLRPSVLPGPSQNPVIARGQPASRLIGITFAPCFNPSR